MSATRCHSTPSLKLEQKCVVLVKKFSKVDESLTKKNSLPKHLSSGVADNKYIVGMEAGASLSFMKLTFVPHEGRVILLPLILRGYLSMIDYHDDEAFYKLTFFVCINIETIIEAGFFIRMADT